MKSRAHRIVVGALAILVPHLAGAEPVEAPAPSGSRAGVRLVAPACAGVPFERARLLELLRVELRPLGVTEVEGADAQPEPAPVIDAASSAVVLVAPFECNETPEVTLTIADRATMKTVTRRVRISDVDAAGRPRVLAIAIAELLGASWVEYALPGAAAAQAGVPEDARRALATKLVPAVSALRSAALAAHAAPAPRVVEPDAERLWSVEAAAITRLFPSRSTAILGGALGASRVVASGVRLRLSAEAAFGDADVPVGSITMGAVTGNAGVGFFTAGATQLEIEPHVALGAGWAKGHADDSQRVVASTYTDFLGIGAVNGTVRARAGRFTPFATLELGYTFGSVEFFVDEARAAGFDSVVFGARLGCGWEP